MVHSLLLQDTVDPKYRLEVDQAVYGKQQETGVPLSHGSLRSRSEPELG